jgi:hypothetical protein
MKETDANIALENMRDRVTMKMITFNVNHVGDKKSVLKPHVS